MAIHRTRRSTASAQTTGIPTARPRLSVIIPVHNRQELTVACLESLAAMPTTVPFEVLVVDNGSTDGTAEALEALRTRLPVPFTVLSPGENLGFARANNLAAGAAAGDVLLFLNNDTEAREDLFSRPCALLDLDAIGIVGVQLRFPDGLIQHAGLAFDDRRRPAHVFRFFPADNPLVGRSRFAQAVTGACLFVRADLFRTCGGFDEGYVNGWEDLDLCFRVRSHGKRVYYCGDVWAIHLESQTPGRLSHAVENEARFRERWSQAVGCDERALYAQVGDLGSVVSRRPRRLLPRAIRFAINIGVPDRGHTNWGDVFYARSLARALQAAGHRAVIQYLDEWHRENRHVDVVIHLKGLSRYEPRPHHVNVVWIINHPELHTPEELNRYDLVFAASASYCERIRPSLRVPCHYLPQAGDLAHFGRDLPAAEPDIDLLFVGNNYDLPRTGRSRAIVEAVMAAGKADKLRVAGEHWEGVLAPGQVLARFVPWEELPALYRRARVVLNDHQETMRTGGFINNRTYDLAFANVFQVSNPVEGLDALGIESYRDPRHLGEILDYYLSHDDERRQKAEEVRTRCADRTFAHAAIAITTGLRRWAEHAPPVEHCDICGYSGRDFLDMGSRRGVRCPRCGSLERHRALWFLLLRDGYLRPGLDVLEISPLNNRVFRAPISAQGCGYTCCDKWPRGNPLDPRDTSWVDVRTDVAALAFADASFDLVLMQHVIEEVPDDRRAFAEIARVLKPGGVAILEIPQRHHVLATEEFGSPHKFGNVRAYGVDVYERLAPYFPDRREEIVDGVSFSVLRRTGPPSQGFDGFAIVLDHPAADPAHVVERVERMTDEFSRAGFVPLTAAQVEAFVRGYVSYRRPAWLTLDDGQAADVTHLLPWLRERRVPATSFVIPGRMAEADWERVRAAAREPWLQVGSHSWQHERRFVSDRLVDLNEGQPVCRNLFMEPVPSGYPIFEHDAAFAAPAFQPSPEVVDFCIRFYREHPGRWRERLAELARQLREAFGVLGTFESADAFARRLADDVDRAHDALRARLGTAPSAFAYPWGRHSEAARVAVARRHSLAVAVAPGGINHAEDVREPFALRRIGIGSADQQELTLALARSRAWERLDYRDAPAVSVLMATRNRPDTVVEAIQSVVDQTFRDWQLIVVNDGGEGIGDIVSSFGDPRVTYLSKAHGGKAAALNLAIEHARGRYIAYLDDDDRFYPNHLDVLVAYLQHHPECRFAYTMAREVPVRRLSGRWEAGEGTVRYGVQADMCRLLHDNCIPNLCAVHERALFQQVGTYDERLEALIDWDMYRRLAVVSMPTLLNAVTAEYSRRMPTGDRVLDAHHITSLYTQDIVRYYRSRMLVTSKLECLRAVRPTRDDCVWLLVRSDDVERGARLLATIAWVLRQHPMDVGLLLSGSLDLRLVSFVQYAERMGALAVWNHEALPEPLFVESVMHAAPWRRNLLVGAGGSGTSHEGRTVVRLADVDGLLSLLEVPRDQRPWEELTTATADPETGSERRVLVIHSAPAAQVAQVIDLLREQPGRTRIHVFGRAHPLLDGLVDGRLDYEHPGAYLLDKVSPEVLRAIRTGRYETVVVVFANRDGRGYENVFQILAHCGIAECVTVNPFFAIRRRATLAPGADDTPTGISTPEAR